VQADGHDDLVQKDSLPRGHGVAQKAVVPRGKGLRHQHGHVFSVELALLVAEDAQGRAVEHLDGAEGVDDDDAVGAVADLAQEGREHRGGASSTGGALVVAARRGVERGDGAAAAAAAAAGARLARRGPAARRPRARGALGLGRVLGVPLVRARLQGLLIKSGLLLGRGRHERVLGALEPVRLAVAPRGGGRVAAHVGEEARVGAHEAGVAGKPLEQDLVGALGAHAGVLDRGHGGHQAAEGHGRVEGLPPKGAHGR
jgi:hypothetical protein